MKRAALLLALAACSSSPDPQTPIPLTTEQFDCRAMEVPERTSVVPVDCIIDPACTEDLVTGHRAAGGNAALFAPENSLAAVRFAILAGFDVIEIDVRHTSDDRLVVVHDGDLSRTTADDRNVDSMTFDEVTQVALDADGFVGDFSCARVPSFREVLELAKGRINIDVDTKTSKSDLVAAEIRDTGMIDQAFVSAGETDKLVRARQTVPNIRLQARPDTVEEYETLLTAIGAPPDIIEVPQSELAAFRPLADQAGSKLFVNVFIEDFVAYAEGDTSSYAAAYLAGADILQSEFAIFVVDMLGRNTWSKWPPPRDLQLGGSPLLP